MGEEQGDTTPRNTPKVGEMFQQAVAAQLAEQRAQRESILEFSQRLEVTERLMTEGLGAVAKVLTACDLDLGHLADRLAQMEQALAAPVAAVPVSPLPEEALARIEDLEAAIVDRLSASDATGRLDSLERRLASFEQTVLERLADSDADALKPFEVFAERLGSFEQAVAEGLSASASGATDRLEAMERRLASFEENVTSRLAADAPGASGDLETRFEIFEEAVGAQLTTLRDLVTIGVDKLGAAFGAADGRYEEAVDAARASREQLQVQLSELEGSVRKFEEQTTEQLNDLRDASTAAEAGILERIILESQTVATHFETVRPAVEAAAQAGPELETTLSELRELAERAMASEESSDSGPYSAEELLAPHADEHADDPLFQPPEETKIPERRFLRRER